MRYRIVETNRGKFIIEGLEVTIKITENWFKPNTSERIEKWKRVDADGWLEIGIVHLYRMPSYRFPQSFKVFKSLDEAKKEVEILQKENIYHYL